MQLDIPIPILLIHPRWFFDRSAKVTPPWIMTFDLDLDYHRIMEKFQDAMIPSGQCVIHLGNSTLDDENDVVITRSQGMAHGLKERLTMVQSNGDIYKRRGVDLVETATRNTIAFHNSLPNSQRAEELAKDYAQLTEKFSLKWKEKEEIRATIPTTFPDGQKPNDHLTDWKKGKTRRHRYTGREAAQADEDNIRRTARKVALENARIAYHNSLEEKEVLRSQQELLELEGMEDKRFDNKNSVFVYTVNFIIKKFC